MVSWIEVSILCKENMSNKVCILLLASNFQGIQCSYYWFIHTFLTVKSYQIFKIIHERICHFFHEFRKTSNMLFEMCLCGKTLIEVLQVAAGSSKSYSERYSFSNPFNSLALSGPESIHLLGCWVPSEPNCYICTFYNLVLFMCSIKWYGSKRVSTLWYYPIAMLLELFLDGVW